MVELDDDNLRKIVREQYGKVAEKAKASIPSESNEESAPSSCCMPSESNQEVVSSSCCGPSANVVESTLEGRVVLTQSYDIDSKEGYSKEELESIPKGANLGLGCGNPTALASIKEGETVIDLGSGAGVDCFLAANKVGKSGKIIGVDMTSQMLDNARQNAKKGNYENVEFRLGEIENLPVADNTANLIISNCVINLSPNKPKVFQEAFRVLKPGGRVMVSDIVLTQELPPLLKGSMEAYAGCVAGAMLKDRYLNAIRNAGFEDVEVLGESYYPIRMMISDETIDRFKEKRNLTTEQVEEIRNFKGNGISMEVRAFKP